MQDAEDIAAFVQRAARGYYKRVHAQVLSDTAAVEPGKARIQEALECIQNAQGEDIVMIFLVPHGISDTGR